MIFLGGKWFWPAVMLLYRLEVRPVSRYFRDLDGLVLFAWAKTVKLSGLVSGIFERRP
ncbi:MAG TPA: hypothetical protein VMV10_29275 [Pirellulales bacterium]|nr:hypothetical protein [Pirellulales bacterium]